MSNTTKTIIALLVVGVLISLLFYECGQNKALKDQIAQSNIHDTTHVPGLLPIDTTKGAVLVKPTHQIYYDSIPIFYKVGVYLDTVHRLIVETKDSVVYDTIKYAFLLQYPHADKIISGKFSQGIAKFDLQDRSGQVESKVYTVDYSKYRYEFFDNQLRSVDTLQGTNFWSQFSSESFFYTTYNPFYHGVSFSADYSLLYKGRIGAYVRGAISTYQTPVASLEIGLKTKIK